MRVVACNVNMGIVDQLITVLDDGNATLHTARLDELAFKLEEIAKEYEATMIVIGGVEDYVQPTIDILREHGFNVQYGA